MAYLGHIISDKGGAVDQDKIKAIVEWSRPHNLCELKGVFMLTRYYCNFEANYARVAHPLTDPLREDNFWWTEEATVAFERLKGTMVEAPVFVNCDATLCGGN